MAANIGPTIKVDGEKEYRQQLANVTQAAKTLGAEMKAVTSSFDENTSAQERAQKTGDKIQEQIKAQKELIAKLEEGIGKWTDKEGAGSTETLKLKEKLAKANEALNNMEKSAAEAAAGLNGLEGEAKESGEEIQDTGEKFDESGKKALSFGDIIKANVISDAIISGIKAVGSAIADAGKAMVGTFTDTVQWADDLATLSTQTGISTEKLQEMQYMADLTDTSVETITGSMTKLTRNMNQAREGTGDAADAFAALGIEITDNNGKLRDNEKVFGEALDALAGMEEGAERDALAMTIFGKSAQDLNPLIAAGSEGVKNFAAEAHEMGYVLEDETVGSLLEVSDSMARLTNAGDAIKRDLSGAFAPLAASAAEDLVPAVSEIAGSIADVAKGKKTFSEFTGEIIDRVKGLAGRIKDALPGIAEQGKAIVTQVIQGASSMLTELAPVAVDIVLEIVDTIKDNLGTVLTAAGDIIMSLVDGMIDALPEIVMSAAKIVIELAQSLTEPENIKHIISSAVELVVTLVGAIYQAAPELIKAAPQIVINLVEGLVGSFPIVLQAGKDMISTMLTGIKGEFLALAEVGKNIGKKIKDNLPTWEDAKQWGRDMIQGLIDGIKAKFQALADAAKSAAQKVASYLHFSRPDIGPLRDYETWMPDMIAGMARGIRQSEHMLDDALNSMTARMAGRLEVAGSSTTTNLGGVSVNVYAAPGQDENAIARRVMEALQDSVSGRQAAWA